MWGWSGSEETGAEGLVRHSSARLFVNATAEFPSFVQPPLNEQVGEAGANRRSVCSEQASFRRLQNTTSPNPTLGKLRASKHRALLAAMQISIVAGNPTWCG